MADPRRCLLLGAMLAFAACASAAGIGSRDEVLYTVQSGDTLIGIAQAQFVEPARWRDLKALNRIGNERRLRPGSTLRIPADWIRQSPAQAVVVAADGEVTLDGRTPRPGEIVTQGARIQTGERGSLSLRFGDGAAMLVQPRTAVQVETLRTLALSGAERTRLRLDQGRVENAVTPQRKPGAQFEVQTPAAVAGVRGTRYRVAEADGAALTEVLQGTVNVAGAAAGSAPVDVGSGFGVRVSAQGQAEAPVALLPAPSLASLPVLQERPLVRFRIPALAGAQRYRAQVSNDASFQSVLRETVGVQDVRFADLPDGDYVLRVRGIDASGLEGRDATHPFRLKARPEPPFPSAPAIGGKIRGQQVEFRWTAAAEADHYVIQIASDPEFAAVVVEDASLRELAYRPDHEFSPGKYRWRIASVRQDGDRGPWSDAVEFAVFPPPAVPEPPALDADKLVLRWPAESGQRFLFQMAHDAQFTRLHSEQRLEQPTVTLPRPEAGSYFIRVQATDPDGFVGPFTATQRIDVPEPPPSPWLLLLLLPLLLL
jgi:hypothetical protein